MRGGNTTEADSSSASRWPARPRDGWPRPATGCAWPRPRSAPRKRSGRKSRSGLARTEIKAPARRHRQPQDGPDRRHRRASGEPLFRIIAEGEIELEGEVTGNADPARPRGRPARIVHGPGPHDPGPSATCSRRWTARPASARSASRSAATRPCASAPSRAARSRSPAHRGRRPGLLGGLRRRRRDRAGRGGRQGSIAPVRTGLVGDGFVEIETGIAAGDRRRQGRQLPARRRPVRPVVGRPDRAGQPAQKGPADALNVSAWSIRKPIPPIVLFIVLMVLGCSASRSCRSRASRTSTSRSSPSP